MADGPAERVRAAAVAAWWTVLIGAIWVTAGWLMSMAFLRCEPEWVRALWGGKIEWPQIHVIWVAMIAGFKVILLLCVLTAVFLSLWARKLKRLA